MQQTYLHMIYIEFLVECMAESPSKRPGFTDLYGYINKAIESMKELIAMSHNYRSKNYLPKRKKQQMLQNAQNFQDHQRKSRRNEFGGSTFGQTKMIRSKRERLRLTVNTQAQQQRLNVNEYQHLHESEAQRLSRIAGQAEEYRVQSRILPLLCKRNAKMSVVDTVDDKRKQLIVSGYIHESESECNLTQIPMEIVEILILFCEPESMDYEESDDENEYEYQ